MDPKKAKEEIEQLKKAKQLSEEQEKILRRAAEVQERLNNNAKKTQERVSEMNSGLNTFAELFGVNMGSVFETIEVEVKQAKRDIATMFDDLEVNAPEIAASIAEEFNSSFRNALPDPKDIQAQINLNSLISEFKSKFPEMGNEMQKAFKTGDIATFYKKFGDEGMKNLQHFMKDKQGFGGMKDWLKPGGQGEKSAINFRQQLESFEPAAQKTTKVVANWGNMFSSLANSLLSFINLKGMFDYLIEYDNKLSNIKREFAIPAESFGKADRAMQGLVKKGAHLGLYMEDAFKLVKTLGDEARTTNIQHLADTAEMLAAIPRATGMAVENVGEIAGKMMFFGASSETARKAFTSIQNSAYKFGLNINKVGKTFNDVFPRFARMGFKGGEESLARMAAKAEKMGIDLNKTLDMSDQFLDLNTALEASADLSLLGGAASQISFIDLMRAAEEGGDALIDLTSRMTGDIGQLGADGMLKLTGMERRRIQGIATATKQDVTQLTNQLQSQLQDKAKLAALPVGFKFESDEQKEFLMSRMVNKGGKWKFEGLDGITDLKKLTPALIDATMNAGAIERANAETRANETKSFQDKMTDFINGLKAEMLVFKPAIDKLGKIFTYLDKALDGFQEWMGKTFGADAAFWAKPIAILGTVLLLTFPRTVMALLGGIGKLIRLPYDLAKGAYNVGKKISGWFKKGSSAAETVTGGSKDVGGSAANTMSQTNQRLGQQKNIFARILDGIKNIFRSFFSMIRTIINGIGSIINSALQVIRNVGTKLVNTVADILNSIVNFIRTVGTNIINSLSQLLTSMLNLLRTNGPLLVKTVSDILGSIIQLIGTRGPALINALSRVLGSTIQLIKTQGTALANALGKVGKAVVDNFFKVVDSVFKGLAQASSSLPAILNNVGKAIGSFFSGMSAGMVTFAEAMATPTLLFGLPVGLIVLAMAMGIAAAIRIAGPGLKAIGEGFGALGKGLGAAAPAIEAAANTIASIFTGIAKVLQTVGNVIVQIIREVASSIMKMSNIPATKLITVAYGITAVATALGLFGGGSMFAGLGQAIGNFFGGDPVKKLTAFANINGANLINVGNGIKLIAISLKNLGTVSFGDFAEQISKLGNLTTGPLGNLSKLSTIGGNIGKGVAAIVAVAKSLQSIPAIDLSKIQKLSTVINLIATNVKAGITKLSTGVISASVAILTAKSLVEITKSLSQVKEVKQNAFASLSKVLTSFMPSIKKGVSSMGTGVLNFQIAKLSASGLANIAKSLNSVPDVKIAPFISLAKIMNTSMAAIKSGLSKLSGMVFSAQLAKLAVSGIASVAKNLSSVPNIKVEPLLNLGKIMSQSMGPIKEGIKKLTSLTVSAQVARIAANGIASVARSLSLVPTISSKPFEVLSKILATYMTGIKTGISLMGAGFAISSNVASVSARGIKSTAQALSIVPVIKSAPFEVLSKILSTYMPGIKKGLSIIGSVGTALSANIATNTAKNLAKIGTYFNTVPTVKVPPFENLNRILGTFIPGISKGIKAMGGGLVISANIAVSTTRALIKIAKDLAVMPTIKSAPFEVMSRVLTNFIPNIKRGIGLLSGGTVVTAKIALITVNTISSIGKSLATVPTLKIISFDTLNRVLTNFVPGIVKGIKLLGGGSALAANVAKLTVNALVIIARTLNTVPNLKLLPFDNLAKIFTLFIPKIRKGISLISGTSALSFNVAKISANALKNVMQTFSTVPTVKILPFDALSKILTLYIPNIKKGLSLIGNGGSILSSFLARGTVSSLKSIAKSFSEISNVKVAPFDALSKIFNTYIPSIKKGITNLGSGNVINSIAANVVANRLVSLGKTLNNVPLVKLTGFDNLILILAFKIPLITKSLKNLVALDQQFKASSSAIKNMSNIGSALANSSKNLLKGLATLSKIGPFAVQSNNSVILIKGLVNNLKQIQPFNYKNLINLASTIKTISPKISSGLASLAKAGFFALPAIIASKSLITITNNLNSVKSINAKVLNNVAIVLSTTSGLIAKGLLKLSTISLIAVPAILASLSLSRITKILNTVADISSKKMLNIALTLSSTGGPISKGLAKLSLLSLIAIPAIISARYLNQITKLLNLTSDLNFKKMLNIGITLSSTSGSIFKGLLKFATLNTVVIPAVLSSRGLVTITKLLSQVTDLNFKKMSNIGLTLSNTSSTIAKGLLKLSTALIFVSPATFVARNLALITKLLSLTTDLNFKKMSNIGLTLSSTSGSIAKGLVKLALISAVILPANASAKGLTEITKNLNLSSDLNLKKMSNIGLTLSTTSGPISKGLAKLSMITLVALPAIAAAKSLVTVTNLVNNSTDLNLKKMSNIGLTLSTTSGPIAKGLAKLATISLVGLPAIASANMLSIITKFLNLSTDLNFKKMSNIGLTLSSTSGPIAKGLVKLALVSLVASPAIAAAGSLSIITRLLNLSTDINFKKMSNIGLTLSSTSGPIAKGLVKLALISTLIIPANASAKGLTEVTKNLNLSSDLNLKKMSNIGLTLSTTSGPISKGLVKLSTITLVALPAIAAAKSLVIVTSLVNNSTDLNLKKMSNIGLTLSTTSGPIAKGLVKLATISLVGLPAIAAASMLSTITKFLNLSTDLNFKKMSNIGLTLSSTSGPIAKGLVKLALVSLVAAPAIAAAGSLSIITRLLNLSTDINFKKMSNIGLTLSSTSGSIAKGLVKLAVISLVSAPAIAAAGSLSIITKLLNLSTDINLKKMSNIGLTLSSTSGPIAKGLAKLSTISLVALPAIAAAKSLAIVTKLINTSSDLNFKKMSNIGLTLNSTSGTIAKGLVKLATVSLVGLPAIAGAKMLSSITRFLNLATDLNFKKMSNIGLTLNNTSGSIAKGLAKLSTISIFVAPSILAARGLSVITKLLSLSTDLNLKKMSNISLVLSNTSGPIAKGLAKLSLLSVMVIPSIVAARGLSTITKILNTATDLNLKKMSNIGLTLFSTSGSIAKGLAKLSLISLVVLPATVAARSLSTVTKLLNLSTDLNFKKMSNIGLTLNSTSGGIAKGLTKLALISLVAIPALIASRSLVSITKTLSLTTDLNLKKLSNIGLTLSSTSGPIAKGLIKLSSVSLVFLPALVASKGLVLITKTLSLLSDLNMKKMSNIGLTLATTSGPIAKGLAKLSLISLVIAPAIAAASSLAVVTKFLNLSSGLNLLKMSNIGLTLSTTSGPIAKGLSKLSLISLVAAPAIAASSSLVLVTKFLNLSSDIDFRKMSNIGLTLATTSGPIAKGLSKLALVGFAIVPAIAAASGLATVTRLLNSTVDLNLKKMLNIGLTLNSTSGPISKGLVKLSLSGLVVIPAIVAANGLVAVTKILNKVSDLNYKKMSNIGLVLNNTAGSISKGLIKFSTITLFVLPAIGAASGITKISNILSKVSLISGEKLKSLGTALSNSASKILWGLTKLSAVNIFTVPAIAASLGLVKITILFNTLTPINFPKLLNIATSLATVSPLLSKGVKALSSVGLLVLGGILASKGIVSITNILKNINIIDSKKLKSIGDGLISTAPNLAKGITTFSKMSIYLIPALIAARGLVTFANILKNIVPINGKTLNNIGTALSQSGTILSSGVRKFSPISIFIIPAILAARGLVNLSKIINQISPISNKSLLSIGNVLNSTGGNILKGLIKLTPMNLFLIPSIFAAKQLVILAKVLNQIPLVNSKGIASIGNATSKESGQVFKGLIKLSSINLAILPAIIAAKSLAKLSKILSSVQQIQVKNLSSISTSLNSTSAPILKAMLKFATITFAIAPAILTAYGLRKLTKVILSIPAVNSKTILDLGNSLNSGGSNLISAVAKWSLITPFIIPAIIAAAGVAKMFRNLGTAARFDLKGLLGSVPVLAMLAPILTKFSTVGLVAPLLMAASSALVGLGRSLQRASLGFVTFAAIPWAVIGTALPTLNALLTTLINFGFKGLIAAPGILAMAATFGVLGRSLSGLSSNFALSTQSMSNYSKESERLRTVANAPKPAITDQTNRLKQNAVAQPAVAAGAEAGAVRTGRTPLGTNANAGGVQVVQIKPIQIDLKLNGRQIQQLIVEANYNRS